MTGLHEHEIDLVHDEASWPAGTPVAFREAYLLPLRALLPSQGLAETSTLVLVAPASSRASGGRVVAPPRRAVLTSDPALYQRLVAEPKPGTFVASPKEACMVAMAGEAGVLAPDADQRWTDARARAAARREPWRLDLATAGLGRVFRTRGEADAALTDPLRGAPLPEVWWEGDPELCPGHWLLRGWTVARLAVAWGMTLERVACGGVVLAAVGGEGGGAGGVEVGEKGRAA